MNINFDTEEKRYKFIIVLKKVCPEFVVGGILFNQKVLTACGKIDAVLQSLPTSEREKFINDNQKFFAGFAWIYYQNWKKSRAKSCAHLMGMYNLLNVNFILDDFVGETLYAGIPKVTSKEVNDAIGKYDTSEFAREKIGIDGKLHPCDSHGSFLEMADINDIYGDGTGVGIEED